MTAVKAVQISIGLQFKVLAEEQIKCLAVPVLFQSSRASKTAGLPINMTNFRGFKHHLDLHKIVDHSCQN